MEEKRGAPKVDYNKIKTKDVALALVSWTYVILNIFFNTVLLQNILSKMHQLLPRNYHSLPQIWAVFITPFLVRSAYLIAVTGNWDISLDQILTF